MRIVARNYAVPCGNGGGKQIKGTAERTNDSAEFSVEDRGQILFRAHYARYLSKWRIQVRRSQLDICCPPGMKPINDDWELGFAPLDGSYRIN
jgi:hypothetical protein